MPYDLRYEPWIPWRRRSGAIVWGPPETLLDDLDGDCVVGLAAPRPDFDGALQEFLIGLLTAALLPEDDDAWLQLAERPPTPAELRAALDRLPAAFYLDGEGPRFFQDLATDEFNEVSPAPVEQLFIDTPGEQTLKLNKDLFVKRARVERVSRPAAAMALLTLQTYAPAGGSGHRTSLRGGGPLTTLVDPRIDGHDRFRVHDWPLWQKLWANVETEQALRERTPAGSPREIAAAFPWLRPTRTSNPKARGVETPPASAHPLEAYFGLPRRIRLEFGDAGCCDLTGMPDEKTVVGFRMRNYGVQYVGWQHPLTPHYRQKATPAEWLPMHGQPGGVSWRDWIGLTLQAGESDLRKPAAVVPAFGRRVGRRASSGARLHVFGYDMDNMKARGWTESIMPLFLVRDAARRRLMRETAARLAKATDLAATTLLDAVKRALFENPAEASGNIGRVRGELWDETESEFYASMARLAAAASQDHAEALADQLCALFRETLRVRALAVFDRWCPAPGLAPEPLRRRVVARHSLLSALNGHTKLGKQLLNALGVPLPGGDPAGRAARKRASQEVTT